MSGWGDLDTIEERLGQAAIALAQRMGAEDVGVVAGSLYDAQGMVAELRAAREAVTALRWYADSSNYLDWCPGVPERDDEGYSMWEEDGGARARAALAVYDRATQPEPGQQTGSG